jgi:hypothetical protein
VAQQGYGGYHSPVSSSVVEAGADRGYDFTGAGTVYTIGSAIITYAGHSGWAGEGGLVVYQIQDGPLKGKYIYNAEDLTPMVQAGPKVLPAGTPIAQATGSGRAPGIEIGMGDGPHGPNVTGHQYAGTYGAAFETLLGQIWGSPVRYGQHPPTSAGGNVPYGAGTVPGFGGTGASPFPTKGGGTNPLSWAGDAGAAIAAEAGALASDRWYPGGQQGFLGGTVGSIGKFFQFITSWRFVEVLGGFLLLLLGLALLGRQFGLNPAPMVLSTAQAAAPPPAYRPPARAAPSGHTKGPSERAEGDRQLAAHNRRAEREQEFRERNPGYDEVPY